MTSRRIVGDAEHPLGGQYVVYRDALALGADERLYWQQELQLWGAGPTYRKSATRYPDQHTARQALIDADVPDRLAVGYEWVPPVVEQLDLPLFEGSSRRRR